MDGQLGLAIPRYVTLRVRTVKYLYVSLFYICIARHIDSEWRRTGDVHYNYCRQSTDRRRDRAYCSRPLLPTTDETQNRCVSNTGYV